MASSATPSGKLVSTTPSPSQAARSASLPNLSPSSVTTPKRKRSSSPCLESPKRPCLTKMAPASPSKTAEYKRIKRRSRPCPPTPLPKLHSKYRFERILQSGEFSLVLLVSIPESKEFRILKIYSIPQEEVGKRKAYCNESKAYAALRKHKVSVDPKSGDRSADPAVPFCYGTLEMNDIGDIITNPDTLLWKIPRWSRNQPRNYLRDHNCWSFEPATYHALLLEYIRGYSFLEVPRLLTRELVTNAQVKLEAIHAAGVLHQDTESRNLILTAGGHVMWLDFDSARTSAYWRIPDEHYAGERMYAGDLLLQTVIKPVEAGKLWT